MSVLDRLFCRLKGHPHAMLRWEESRLSLLCPDCLWQSPGWAIGQTHSKVVKLQARSLRRRSTQTQKVA